MPKSLLVFLLLCAALPFQAQTPYLVKDINTAYSYDTKSSTPSGFTSYHGKIFFTATNDLWGAELWSSDGNSATLVADIIPGKSGSGPAALKVVNDVLVFNARDVDHGMELWATDGTAAGTRLLLDINPGPSSSLTTSFSTKFNDGNRLFFVADDGTNGRELWMTDGTSAGTRLVKDLNPGPTGSFADDFVAFNNSVYFTAAGGLWKTDGTTSGTVLVAPEPLGALHLTVVGERLFFQGFGTGTEWEPWVSDGTTAGTRIVKDINAGAKSSMAASLTFGGFIPLGNNVLFIANDGGHGRELWITDGTAAGTRMVLDFFPGPTGLWDQGGFQMAALGNRVFFTARDLAHGEELWVTDGTAGGTALFRDLRPGMNSSSPSAFVVVDGKLFFTAQVDDSFTARLGVTDGSTSGTRIISVGEPPGPGVTPRVLTPLDGKVYFAGTTALYATEPWVSDGTDAGTRMLANVAPDAGPSSIPTSLIATNHLLFFNATDGVPAPNSPQRTLWSSDGTANGTLKLRGDVDQLKAAGPFVFFKESINGREWLMSDGTVEGTKSAGSFMNRFGFEKEVEQLFTFGETIFAVVSEHDGADPILWKSTAALNAPAVRLGARNPYGLIEVAGHYVFYADSQTSTRDGLWTTDGTAAGTYPIVPDLASNQRGSALVNAAGTVFFLKQEEDQNPKLWKSDGTFDGTTAVREVPGIAIHRTGIVAVGRRVFFGSGGGNALWTSDGTEAGTIKIDTVELPIAFDNDIFEPVGERVLFVSQPGTDAAELWSSDGTQSGTIKLGRIATRLVNIEGIVYFGGTDEAHGTELWTTDGTVEGTKLLVDLQPGPGSSTPTEFTKLGDTIYFAAYTDATGRELWALPLTEARLSIADARASDRDGAVVRFAISLAGGPAQTVTVDYATANGTAQAGVDYTATTGTLTFLPGETTKFINVAIAGDSSSENNETFFLLLNNAKGARVVKGEAAGVIVDDDQFADLSVTPVFGESGGGFDLFDAVSVSNLGPRTATEIALEVTSTPAHSDQRCKTCSIPQIANGASATTAYGSSTPSQQTYLSAIASARQQDPQTSNNRASWTVNANRTMAMNAAYLVTGQIATVTAISRIPAAAFTPADPSIVVTSSPVKRVSDNIVTVNLTAIQPGTSLLHVSGQATQLLVTVVAPGTSPRWPGGVSFSTNFTARRFDQPVTVTVTPVGSAPLTGATATGTVTVTSAGRELARREIGGTKPISFPIYLPALDVNAYQIAYSGDANFLPQTFEGSVFVHKGNVSMTGTVMRTPGTEGTYTVTLQVAGSPAAAPTGIVTVAHGTTEIARITLQPSSDGKSHGQATVTNLPRNATLTLNYAGDTFYLQSTQHLRAAEARRRGVRH